MSGRYKALVAVTVLVGGALAAAAPTARADGIAMPVAADFPVSVTDVAQGAVAAGAYAALWCVQGAVLTAAFSALVSLPATASGVGVPITTTGIGGAAVAGCGVGVAWGATLSATRWVADRVFPISGPPSRQGLAIAAGG